MSKISELSDGGALQSTDYLIAVRSGGNVKVRPNGAVSGTTGQFSTSLNVDGTVTADAVTLSAATALLDMYDSDGTNQRLRLLESGGSAYFRSQNGTSHGTIRLQTEDGTNIYDRLVIASNGDVSLYEDTGTTPKFFWDASAESLSLTGEGTLPASIGGAIGVTRTGYNATGAVIGRTFIGDGTGYSFHFSKRASSTTTDLVTINDTGNVGIGVVPTNRFEVKSSGSNANEITLQHSGNTVDIVALGQLDNHGSIQVKQNSGAVQHSIYATGGVVFNDGSIDQDFRVESDSNTHALFVDASSSRVGVNTSSPQGAFHATGLAYFDKTPTDTEPNIRLRTVTDSLATEWGIGQKPSSTEFGISHFNGTGWSNFVTIATDGTVEVGEYIRHLGDSNTYFGFPGGDQFSLVTGAANRLKVVGSETVFNEDSGDRDFRVESDGYTNMLFVDAGENWVGVNASANSAYTGNNTGAPARLLVNGATASRGASVDNVGTTYVNSNLVFSNTTTVELVTIAGTIQPGNAYSSAAYIMTSGAFNKTLTQLGSASDHFGNGYLSAQLDSSSASSVNLQVRWNGVGAGTGTVVVNAFKLI